jgi:Neuraminidase (sialidase)
MNNYPIKGFVVDVLTDYDFKEKKLIYTVVNSKDKIETYLSPHYREEMTAHLVSQIIKNNYIVPTQYRTALFFHEDDIKPLAKKFSNKYPEKFVV